MAAESLRTKWMSMTASIWIQCTGGGSYTFGIYSAILKSSQSYDQSTLDTVSVFKDIGGNVGVLSGLLYTAATFNGRRRQDGREGRGGGGGGPWVVILIGAILCFTGYIFMWASVTGLIRRPVPVPVMCLFMFTAAQSLTFLNTANVVSSVENFADYGGTAVGIMKGFVGLSGAMLIQLYETICPGDPTSFILLLAIVPSLLSVLVMPLVRIYETSTSDEKKHLDGLSTLSLIIAAYLMIIIIVKSTFGLPSWANAITLTILLILLASPLLIAVRAHRDNIVKPLSSAYSPLVDNLEATTTSGEIKSLVLNEDQSLNLLQAMRNVDFWLLFLAMICGMGSGISTINNMRQIGESLRYSSVEINALLSLWSIWNFIGRFGAGYASDALLHRKGWPRPLLMATTLGTMTIGHLIIASGFQGNLYAGSIIVGICYGSQWSLMPTITSELFGVKHMGTIYNTISIASPMGSYIFSVRLIGYIYDQTIIGQGNTCYGPHCFRLSFVIIASVAFLGFLVSFVLVFRTKIMYQQIFDKRSHYRRYEL